MSTRGIMSQRNPIDLTPEVAKTFKTGTTIILCNQECTFLEYIELDKQWQQPAIRFYNHPSKAGGRVKLSAVQYDPMHTRPKIHLIVKHYDDGQRKFQSHEVSCGSPELDIERKDTGYGSDFNMAVLTYRENLARNIVKMQQQIECINHGNFSSLAIDYTGHPIDEQK